MADLVLGLDLGTSGVRAAVTDGAGVPVAMARAHYPDDSAEGWWRAAAEALHAVSAEVDAGLIRAAAVCGTSGTMVLTDAGLHPVTPGLLYDSAGFEAEGRAVEAAGGPPGAASAPARMLRLQALVTRPARHLMHQADFVTARLRGAGGVTDDTNALKLGWDPATKAWAGWIAAAGFDVALLPQVRRVGARLGPVAPEIAARFGWGPSTIIRAGTTDSIGAFLAAGAGPGEAVTSLGTTLVLKLMSDVRIDDRRLGVYSHRFGDHWLVGGASNTGAGVLAAEFPPDRLQALSARIDPSRPSGLDYYPLLRRGERFPVSDPDLAPRMTPRPADDAAYLHGLLEGMARIEAAGYRTLHRLGAPVPTRILTAGGGATNETWTAIRARHLPVRPERSAQSEAAVGLARLCLGP